MLNRINSYVAGRLTLLFLVSICTLMLSCSKTTQLSKQEKGLLFTEQNFARDLPNVGRKRMGKFSKELSYLERSTTLDYEVTLNSTFYLMNTFSLSKNASDALKTAFALRTGAVIGVKIGDITDEEIPLNNQFDGKATLLLLKMDNRPVGNVFTYVHENKTWFVILTGLYFDNEQNFTDYFASHISKIKAFKQFEKSAF